MIYRDTIIPNSHLLAFARGDHWAVAMPFSESSLLVRTAIANRTDFPRTVLLRSIMIVVQRELDARGSAGTATTETLRRLRAPATPAQARRGRDSERTG